MSRKVRRHIENSEISFMINHSVFVSLVLFMLALLGVSGKSFAAGSEDTVATVIDKLSVPTGVATDLFGNIYYADTGGNKIVMTTAAGVVPVTIGTGTAGFIPTAGFTGLNTTADDKTIQLNAPTGVAVDALGNVYIADTGNHRIHKITADTKTKQITSASSIVTIAGTGTANFFGDNDKATAAGLKSPTAVVVDAAKNIYIADNGNYRIRKVDSTGKITTISGDGFATTLTPYSLAISPAGDLFIADSGNNRILKIAAVKDVTDNKTAPVQVAGSGTAGYFGDGGLALLAKLDKPSGIATDGTDLYISDTMNNCIRKVSLTTMVITTRAGSADQANIKTPTLSNPTGIAIASTGDVLFADSGNNSIQKIFASISAITTASPPGGTYRTTQTVTLTASKAAKIYYTTDKTPPIIPKFPDAPALPTQLYTVPIVVTAASEQTTIMFTSSDVAAHPEVTNTAVYTFDTIAPTTTSAIYSGVSAATPVPTNSTTYYSAQSALTVVLTSTDPLSTIYYTTTGIPPTTASAKYAAPISIPVTGTMTTTNVQFFAVDVSGNNEVVQSNKYSIAAISTTASLAGGVYPSQRTVSLSSNDSTATIYYTLDGTDPVFPIINNSSTLKYLDPLTVSKNTHLKFRAQDKEGNLEPIKSQIYTIDNTAPITTASPSGSAITAFKTPQTVTLTTNELNTTIYYTLTGSAPTIASTKYTGPIVMPVNKTTKLMFFAVDQAGNQEVVKSEEYTIDTVAPTTTASVLSGTYSYIQPVTLTTDEPSSTIYFTIDGTTPEKLPAYQYKTPIALYIPTDIPTRSPVILKYFAVDQAGNTEPVKSQIYNLITLTTTASPKGGTFNSVQTVSLSANGVGAKIYYTTDGTPPTKSSKLYTTPILMTDNKTKLQFFQVDASGIIESAKTEIYTVDIAPPTTTLKCATVAAVAAPLPIASAYDIIKLTATDDTDLLPKIKFIANTDTSYIINGVSKTATKYTLTDYIGQVKFTSNTIIKFFAVDAAGNTEQIKTGFCPVVAGAVDPNPSLYLETLPEPSTTSAASIYVSGNVAPFNSSWISEPLNVTTNTTDGSFSYKALLAPGANTITTTVTDGVKSISVQRNITEAGTTQPSTLSIATGTGVVGHDVRVPIKYTSGYQAAALSIDITYDTKLSNPGIKISNAAAASGKIISSGITGPGKFRILIMDDPVATTIKAIPDGDVAYLSFSLTNSVPAGNYPLTTTYTSTNLDSQVMPPNTVTSQGAVNVVSKPGNTWTAGVAGAKDVDTPVDLKGVLGALYMLLNIDPGTYPVGCQVDMNADGVVQINELQQVINSFLGM